MTKMGVFQLEQLDLLLQGVNLLKWSLGTHQLIKLSIVLLGVLSLSRRRSILRLLVPRAWAIRKRAGTVGP